MIHQIKKILGSGFYTGYFPFAPGTIGSLLALILYFIPIFFKIAYKIVRPFIDKDTKKKIFFEKKKKGSNSCEFTNNDSDILDDDY